MRRTFVLAVLFVCIDQALKFFCQFLLKHDIYINSQIKLTYIINEALFIHPGINNSMVYLLFGFSFLVWCLALFLIIQYQKCYRKSWIVDIAFAFYTMGILGNIIDKVMFGYIRDVISIDYIIFNLADVSGLLGLVIFCLEFIFYPKSRELLKIKKQ